MFDDGELGRTSKIRHAITTFGPPIRQPIRRLPVALKKTVQEEVQKIVKNKVIRPSTMQSLVFTIIMIRKKDGSWRFCIDFRKLIQLRTKMPILCRVLTKPWNLWLVLQSFPIWISRIGLLASGVGRTQYKEKTAFSTTEDHFEFNVMHAFWFDQCSIQFSKTDGVCTLRVEK